MRQRTCSAMRLLLLIALTLVSAAVAAQTTASGTINAVLVHKQGISLVFQTGTGLPLVGSNTANASVQFGNVNWAMTPPAGMTFQRTAADFTVGTSFLVDVTVSGVTNPTNYNLTAALNSAPGALTYKVDGIQLPASLATVPIAAGEPYTPRPHTISLTIPVTVPAQSVSNTVTFTATAN